MKTISITDSKEIENIIRQCPYCMVGITDADGHPYVIPMNFAYEKGIIYLHSGPDGGKLEMIRQHPDHLLRRTRTGVDAPAGGLFVQHEEP